MEACIRKSDLGQLMKDVAGIMDDDDSARSRFRETRYRVHISTLGIAEGLFNVVHWDMTWAVRLPGGQEVVPTGGTSYYEKAMSLLRDTGEEYVVVSRR